MDLNDEQVQIRLRQLARKMGSQNASNLLSVLGRDKAFINAIETPEGQEILKVSVSAIEDCIALILQEKDTPSDRAELKAYMKIMNKWQGIINRYGKNKEKFEDSMK